MDNANVFSAANDKNALLGYFEEALSQPVRKIYFAPVDRECANKDTAIQPWARFSIVLGGEFDLEIIEEQKPRIQKLHPGDVMVMPELAYCRNTFARDCRCLGAVRRNNYLRLFYHDFKLELKNIYPDIQYHIEDTLHLSTIHAFSAFVEVKNAGVSEKVIAGFYRLMLELIVNDLKHTRQKHYDKSYFIWMNVVAFIERHYDRPLTRKQIGDELKISESYLSKLFRKYAGMPVNEFQTRIRMDKALELLKDPTLRISEIAYNCGYQSVPFFIKKFKDYYSATPAQYRLRFN